jgi:hypothetical protein
MSTETRQILNLALRAARASNLLIDHEGAGWRRFPVAKAQPDWMTDQLFAGHLEILRETGYLNETPMPGTWEVRVAALNPRGPPGGGGPGARSHMSPGLGRSRD